MGGFFGVASESSCVLDLFFGTDYHSHLGTKRGGMAVYGPDGFSRAIHNIENSPFRTKFERDVEELEGNMGIGCISDSDPQPLLVQSHLGSFAITTVGKVNNAEELIRSVYENGCTHFLEMSGSRINTSELMAALISQKSTIVEGLQYMQERVDGSMSVLLLTADGIYAARDRWGRTPLAIGCKEGAYCVSFEDFAFGNLGYTRWGELGPGEIVRVTSGGVERLVKPRDQMKICTFLWVYYGYPTSSYEGVNVEEMRYKCGAKLVDISTANNTIAIVMSGPIAKDISQEYKIPPRRTAALLDIFTSVWQGLIPYGAQLLAAASALSVTPLHLLPYLFYPVLMGISAIFFILFGKSAKKQTQ